MVDISEGLFSVSDDRKWGYLVMSWAIGLPVPGTNGFAPKRPTTLDELKAQCKTIGLEINIASYHTDLEIVQGRVEALTIRLPPKEILEESRKAIGNNANYDLPKFYSDIFGHPPMPMDAARKLDLQAERVGDYAVGMCM